MTTLSDEQFEKLRTSFAESSGGIGTYGAYAVLFMITTYTLINKGLHKSRARQVLFAILLVIFVVCTANAAIYTKLYYMTLGSFQFKEDHQVTIDKFLIVLSLFSHINSVLSDGIVVWRAWVLYPRNLKVKAFLVFCMIGTIVTASVDCSIEVKDMPRTHEARSGLGTLWFYLTLLGTNIAATCLVAYKFWEYHTSKTQIDDSAIMISRRSGERPKVEKVLILLMESGFIYCFYWVTVMLSAVRVTADVGHEVLECVLPQIQGIYLTVVILLVTHQKDERDTTSIPIATRNGGISTINFAHTVRQGTGFSDTGSTGREVHTVQVPQIGQSFVERVRDAKFLDVEGTGVKKLSSSSSVNGSTDDSSESQSLEKSL
ncbi:hypothetical protein VKT23_018414 [Stygiomarasmius scandens]|uniref:Uncharacterized protein n=1 Tax=Marasmiellus scandens TaxID=2682957 RepID=A0ABR1IP42_9AGAR